MTFWPDSVNSSEVRSPSAILEDAARELEERASVLSVQVRHQQLEDRLVLRFQVTNTAADVSFTLFEVHHRIGLTYPAVFVPPASDIPEFLKKRKYVPGNPGMNASSFQNAFSIVKALAPTDGFYVDNEWVCGNPVEFKDKLRKLLAADYVVSRVLSLISPAPITQAPQMASEHGSPQLADEPSEISESTEPPSEQ